MKIQFNDADDLETTVEFVEHARDVLVGIAVTNGKTLYDGPGDDAKPIPNTVIVSLDGDDVDLLQRWLTVWKGANS